MGRVSQSKQNNFGKDRIEIQNIPTPIRQERSRRDMRTSATSAAVQSRNPVEGVPTRPSQPTGGASIPALPSDYKETEQAAGQTAENSRAGAGFGGQTRVSPTGVVQKGTNTSPAPMTMDDANKLLSDGYKINTTYASNQLPYTQSSPYAGKSNAQIYNPETLHQFDGDADNIKLANNLFDGKSGVEAATPGKSYKEGFTVMDVNPGEKVSEEKINWANRTMADNSDAKMARRRAFLDAKGSMQGLRDSEALQGITYQKGNHYIADGEGGDSLIKVDNKDDMRTYKSGAEGAREIRDKYVNKLKGNGSAQEISDISQNAPAMLPDSVSFDSSIDKSPFDIQDTMQQTAKKSIIGDNKSYTSARSGTLFR